MTKAPSLIVIFSGAAFSGVQRSAKGMAHALSVHTPVLFVDPTASTLSSTPADWITKIEVRPELTRVSPNLYHLSSVAIPGHTRVGLRGIARSALLRRVRQAIAEIGEGDPRAVLLQSPRLNVLGSLGEETSVYWATDSFTAGSTLMGVNQAELAEAEQAAVSHADLVIAVSEHLASIWRTRGKKAVVVKNGVDTAKRPQVGLARPDDLTVSRPIAGVVGTISNRLDFPILQAVAEAGISIAIVGPWVSRVDATEFESLCSRQNVIWTGPKPHRELVNYYRHMDVGLVPYTLSEFNRVSAPLKPLEYLASGLPVVTTDLPGVVAIDSPDIVVANSREQFVDATKRAIEVSRRPELIERRSAHIQRWSWDERAKDVLRILDTRPSR